MTHRLSSWAAVTVLTILLAWMAAFQALGQGGAQAQTCTPEAQFLENTRANLAQYGSRLRILSMAEDMARAYFAELDKAPPATTTAVDTGYLILIQDDARIGAIPVKDGRVCGHYTIGIGMHLAILRSLRQRESPPASGLSLTPGLDA